MSDKSKLKRLRLQLFDKLSGSNMSSHEFDEIYTIRRQIKKLKNKIKKDSNEA